VNKLQIDLQGLMRSKSPEDMQAYLSNIVRSCIERTQATPGPIQLRRGLATIPLSGIDVPFHSSHLKSGVAPFRDYLYEHIDRNLFDPEKLIGKYIPNLTATPFEVSRDYFRNVLRLTGSSILRDILAEVSQFSCLTKLPNIC
jgi:fatty acid synthase subunit beta, fungi type